MREGLAVTEICKLELRHAHFRDRKPSSTRTPLSTGPTGELSVRHGHKLRQDGVILKRRRMSVDSTDGTEIEFRNFTQGQRDGTVADKTSPTGRRFEAK